jgi:hypothetical protein
MKNLTIVLFHLIFFQTGFTQNENNLYDFQKADSLSVLISTSSGFENKYNQQLCSLSYDLKFQFPYYTYRYALKKFDTIRLKMETSFLNGVVYAYSFDADNNFRFLDSLVLDSADKNERSLSFANFSYPVKYTGEERVILLYATVGVSNLFRILKGIELTYGSFVLRHNGNFGNYILKPNNGWNVLENKVGFVIDEKLAVQNNKWYLPLIIEFDVNK